MTLPYATIQDLVYTANQLGGDITVTYKSGGTAGSEVVTVTDARAITVEIEAGVSTATQIKAAVVAHPRANELVAITTAEGGSLSNAQNTCVLATMSGGAAATYATKNFGPVKVTAKASGTAGNSIRVRFVAGTAGVAVDSNDITVTFPAGSPATTVIGLINADVSASALVVASNNGSSLPCYAAMASSLTNLAGGAAATNASVVVQDLTYAADTTGTAKNGSTVTYTTGATAGAEVVAVSGNDISVQIENGVSTATQIKAAFDASALADGVAATGTITVANYASLHLTAASLAVTYGSPDVLTAASKTVTVVDYTKAVAAAATPSGVLTYGTPSNSSTVIVTGVAGGPYTFTKVASDPEANQFTSIAQLTYLLNQINGLDATNDGSDITLTVETVGTAANAWVITGTSSYSALNITFSGGQDNAVVTVAGHALTQGVDWTAETSNDVTADNLAAAIDALSEVTAPNPAAAVITVSAATAGTAGNAITLVTSNSAAVSVGGATLSGGLAASTFTIGGDTYTCVAADPGATEFSSIAELTALIQARSTTNATDNGSIITIVAATAGTAGNSIAVSKTGAGLTFTGSTLAGGIAAATVTVAGHVLTESTDWTASSSNDSTAESLKDAIHALSEVSCTRSNAVCNIVAAAKGTAGNAITLASSSATNLALSGALLTGGTDAWSCTVSGTGSTAQETVNAAAMAGAVGAGAQGYYLSSATTALTTSFVAYPWGFSPTQLIISNDEASGNNTVIGSWDGVNTHFVLKATEKITLDLPGRYGVWLKYGTGAAAYRVTAI